MIRINVYMSIASIGFGMSTTVAGFYGMNLLSGLETSPTAFDHVVISTSIGGIAICAICMAYISKTNMKKRAMQRLDEIETLSGILNYMTALDYVVKTMRERKKKMTKSQFIEKFIESKQCSEIKEKEVNFLFNILDTTKDGMFYQDDFHYNYSSRSH